MKPRSPLGEPYRNVAGHPDSTGHRSGPFVATCEAIFGYPKCWTAVAGGAHGQECSCDPIDLRTLAPLTEEQHVECERRAREAYRERDGAPCADCAFRPGSPEMRDELTLTVAMQQAPFRCHQGMPLRFTGKDEDGTPRVSYEPRDPLATTYPVCNGWAFFKALDKDDAVDAITEVSG